MTDLSNRRVLILATDGYEDVELFAPRTALIEAGVKVTLASPNLEAIRGVIYNFDTGDSDPSGETIEPDMLIGDAAVSQFDALVLPGGVVNPDKLRLEAEAIALVRDFVAAGKPVASICHGPWILIEADVVRGKRTTGWYSIRTDLRNAGSTVVDEEVVVDGNIITSRMPTDIPAFTKAIFAALEA